MTKSNSTTRDSKIVPDGRTTLDVDRTLAVMLSLDMLLDEEEFEDLIVRMYDAENLASAIERGHHDSDGRVDESSAESAEEHGGTSAKSDTSMRTIVLITSRVSLVAYELLGEPGLFALEGQASIRRVLNLWEFERRQPAPSMHLEMPSTRNVESVLLSTLVDARPVSRVATIAFAAAARPRRVGAAIVEVERRVVLTGNLRDGSACEILADRHGATFLRIAENK